MVTPATSFFDADSNLEKLVGGGRVCKCRQKKVQKTLNFALGTFVAYETSAGLFPTDYLRPELLIAKCSAQRIRRLSDRQAGASPLPPRCAPR